ncbi:MAG: hypothetical protein IPK62_02895 [Bacteroidetes bacterium]|nr:hypothetical protein [Bacteroidota bacterium]MBK8144012.1 hypothetical protein [Bacteroidota bacterium]
MTTQSFNQAIQACKNGSLKFNRGKRLRSFLFENKWYPLRACVNHARKLCKESKLTTDSALVQEVNIHLGLWTRISTVNNQTKNPIALSADEIAIEVKSLSKIIYELTNL